tara:strand:- start:402 stop:1040 length:639 start_codon:yes stop_codon:yes gene_type:complete
MINSHKEKLTERLELALEDVGYDSHWKVLDLGCADLRPYSEFLIKSFHDYVGIDADLESIDRALAKVNADQQVHIVKGASENLELESETFDLVVCNNMLAYTDKKKSLSEISRVLKKGGYCISLANNTIEYSIYKMAHPVKFRPVECLHSLVVIFNTWIYRISKVRFFRTTYHTIAEVKGLLKEINVKVKILICDKSISPYSTIGFVFQKDK